MALTQDITNTASTSIPSPPASPLLTRASESEPTPAIEEPARKRRRKGQAIRDQTDEEVWNLTDAEILEAEQQSWSSDVYNHYDASLTRLNKSRSFRIVFKCKYRDHKHSDQYRERMNNTGTGNLNKTAKSCDKRNHRPEPIEMKTTTAYTEDRHRALIAIRSAQSKRPFHMVEDPYYVEEVELLRPGTKLPSSDTVAKDIQRLYQVLSGRVQDYFQKRDREIHAVVDGWTAPIAESYLGVEIVWEDKGKIWTATLEFVRLTEKHEGKYLAEQFASTMKRYGLDKFLHVLMMDNAGNCNTTARFLPNFIPNHRGVLARGRCFDHIIQLAAKVTISFFFKQPKKKKTIKVTKSSARHAGSQAQPDELEEIVVGADEVGVDAEDLEIADVLGDEEDAVDPGKEAHDTAVSNSIRDIVIREMAREGVAILQSEQNVALKVFPKIAGLAKKIHDSRTLGAAFAKACSETPELTTEHAAISRRNATRWGSEKRCLSTYRALRPAVNKLLEDKDLKLGSYKLNSLQDRMAKELELILKAYDEVAHIFEVKGRALVIDILPAFESLEHVLKGLSNYTSHLAVSRVAARAGYRMIQKYYSIIDECEAYRISIVLCPDRKLSFFERELHWTEAQINDLRSLVIRRFDESYAPPAPALAMQIQTEANSDSDDPLKMFQRPSMSHNVYEGGEDDIRTYLAKPLTETNDIIGYWTEKLDQTPYLAKYALSFCSAPATSADSERSFSEGRHQISWNQTSMSSQAFRAKMSVGSWSRAPFFSLEDAVTAIANHSAPLR
ncbi:hypothetical protein VKT23_010660 [Stygiomarasmius scandens]|uniref:HAT C-terminal dimerisation domain-containing protein n=1 Tax=Marasmiellus scandens TaxID=2682957 RepID=A0ABR1JF19_9AGAR